MLSNLSMLSIIKKNPLSAAVLALMLVSTVANIGIAEEKTEMPHPELKPYPTAEQGLERFVVSLPEKSRAEASAYRVEIIPGKMLSTDGVNHSFLAYELESHVVEGWGYPYYKIVGTGMQASTLMGVTEGAAKVTQFVAGKSITIPYNSRLPLVVYGPKDAEVRYRIWQAADITEAVPRG